MKDKLNNKNTIIIVIVLLLILGIGFSYAWWRYTAIQDKTNVGVSKCFSIELANQANEINLTNMYPITDEEGRKLTPYTFTLKNTCSVSAKYSLNMEMLEGTTLNSNYLAVLVNNKNIKLLSSYNTATTVIGGSTESRTLDTGILAPNGSKYYSISLWMDKSVTLSDAAQNKVFKSKVVVDAVAAKTAIEKIIASVDTTGKCPTINSDGTVNVTKAESTDGYVCSASDTYGTSYYYRGNVTNNYVKFADKYWRIIRVNGDGTVRVIYDGTSANVNGKYSEDRFVGTSEFNISSDDNAYVGYMYGEKDSVVEDASQYGTTSWTNTSSYYVAKEYTYNASTDRFTLKDPVAVLTTDLTADYIGYYSDNSTSNYYSNSMIYQITSITTGDTSATVGYKRIYYGTSSKEVAQTNTNDSTIKTYLDNWYKTNISGTENEQYLADNIFCNDRSFSSSNSGTGAGMVDTQYHWYDRNASKSNLKCPQQNDAFTVSDTINGNGALTYPIGLITLDETILAGGWNTFNRGYYLYSGSWYWTSSPDSFGSLFAFVHIADGGSDAPDYSSNGSPLGSFSVNSPDGGVRPVLNLSPEVLKNGDGTMNNPYHP